MSPPELPLRTPQVAAVLPDATLLCAACEYDLRGLPISGRCPECGVPIWKSVPSLFQLSWRDWAAIRRGLRLIFLANAVDLVAVLVLLCSYGSIPSRQRIWLAVPIVIVVAGVAVARVRGYTLLATVAPDVPSEARPKRPREFLVNCVHMRAWLACGCVPVVTGMELCSSMVDWSFLGFILAILLLVFLSVMLLQFAATIRVLEAIAKGSMSDKLLRLPEHYSIALGLAFVIGLPIFAVGVPIAWFIYHALMFRFYLEANSRLRPEPSAPISQ